MKKLTKHKASRHNCFVNFFIRIFFIQKCDTGAQKHQASGAWARNLKETGFDRAA
jgi:hypothetical protein